MRALVVALTLLCAAGVARADATAEARAHYKEGLALFNEGRFVAARAAFEAGYQLQPLPLFLFNAAQAARRADDAAGALALYRKFVAADPQSAERAEAEQHIAELSAKLPPPAADEPQAAPTPASAPPAAAPTVTTPPPSPAPTLVRARAARDVADPTLMALGAAGAATGAILLGIGGARLADAQSTYGSFDLAHGATPLVVSGAVLAGAGATLLVVGAIRYAIRRHRARR